MAERDYQRMLRKTGATLAQPFRFLVVGGLNTIAAYLLFLAFLALMGPFLRPLASSPNVGLDWLGRHWYLVVQWTSWVFGVQLSTFTMKHFVFMSRGRYLHELPKAYLVYLPAQGLSSVVLWFAVAIMHLTPQVGQLLAAAIAMVFAYVGHKSFTFRTLAKAVEESSD